MKSSNKEELVQSSKTNFSAKACPSCGYSDLNIFYKQHRIPIDSCRLESNYKEAKRCTRGSINLAFCRICGFIFNASFDPSIQNYCASYEETQKFSRRFREFTQRIAISLIEKYQLYGKDIFEIGCGHGEFLSLICKLGNNCGVGVDPNFDEKDIEGEVDKRVTFIKDYFSERYAHLMGNFIICRHTLEHIMPVRDFIRLVRRSFDCISEVIVFFEVPDVMRILKEGAFWDIYYEHCSYFTCGSLARLFRSVGFEVLNLSLEFDAQYILIECLTTDTITETALELEESPIEVDRVIDNFSNRLNRKMDHWRYILESAYNNGKRVVLWGSGSKSAAFMNALNTQTEIEYIVNINHKQHGKYIVGTGQQIVPPEFLSEYKPDIIILTNPIYYAEVKQKLLQMGLSPQIITL